MTQLTLIPHICDAQDDNGVRCLVEMTAEEIEQDGMCFRCAEGIWGDMHDDEGGKFIIKDPKTREF